MSVVVWNTSLPYWNSCKLGDCLLVKHNLSDTTQFQLRYLLYTLYTFMRIFHYPSSFILLMALTHFSTVSSYTLLFSVQHWSKLCTAFTSRTSTVLGRFYYGISRHSTQIFIKSVMSSHSIMAVFNNFLFLYWGTCWIRTNVNNCHKVAPKPLSQRHHNIIMIFEKIELSTATLCYHITKQYLDFNQG